MMDEKAILRRELKARRAKAFADFPDAAARLTSHFPSEIVIEQGTIIGAYMPLRSEIDPRPLVTTLVSSGAKIAMPRISPSPLRGGDGVGVTERIAQQLESSGSEAAPHPPTPSPPGGRGDIYATKRAQRLRAAPTRYEQKLWDLLRAKRPNQTHWRRQVPIGGYVFDFGCHGLRLLIEVDGGIHGLPEVQDRDARKAAVAYDHGYRLIRLQNEDVLKIETAEYFDQFAKESPSPLWGGVGVGGASTIAELSDSSRPEASPNPPTLGVHAKPTQGGGGGALTFHLCDPDNPDHFQRSKWGIIEPKSDLPIARPSILLVPLLGYDRYGNRLGYGKGYYDQAIASLNAITIGLGFSAQEVPEIPTQPHDQRLDWIITENGAYRSLL